MRWGSLARLKAEGKIREYELPSDSVDDAAHLPGQWRGSRACRLPFGLMDPEALDGVFDRVSDRQLGIIARGVVSAGAR